MSTPAITPNPYADFQQPAKVANPYAEFQEPAKPTTPPTDARNGFQKAIDAAATPDTDAVRQKRTQFEQGIFGNKVGKVAGSLENFGNDLTQGLTKGLMQPLAHPIDTATGILKSGAANAANFTDPTGHVAHAIGLPSYADSARSLVSGVKAIPQNVREQGGLVHAIPSAVGNITGTMALGELGGEAVGGLKNAGSAIRSAAIGDTDAAALRGLRVKPKGKEILPMQSDVQTARPFLGGGSPSLEDLQSRIKPAKTEAFAPYKQTLDAVGDNPVKGPDGMTTIRALEDERKQLSAMNRGLKSGDPAALQLAQQKGLTQAESLAREKAVQAHLDPELSRYGIDPEGIRGTYGSIARVGNQIQGRSTLLEKTKPYGFAKVANPFELAKGLDVSRPSTYGKPLSNLFGAGRDVAAGRYWSASPTDVGIREGFADAGPKPDLGQYKPFKPAGFLPAPKYDIELGGPKTSVSNRGGLFDAKVADEEPWEPRSGNRMADLSDYPGANPHFLTGTSEPLPNLSGRYPARGFLQTRDPKIIEGAKSPKYEELPSAPHRPPQYRGEGTSPRLQPPSDIPSGGRMFTPDEPYGNGFDPADSRIPAEIGGKVQPWKPSLLQRAKQTQIGRKLFQPSRGVRE